MDKARFGGYKYGNGALIDGLIHDGLWDVYNKQHMGMCGEVCALIFINTNNIMMTHHSSRSSNAFVFLVMFCLYIIQRL
jgi:hypothetical protein